MYAYPAGNLIEPVPYSTKKGVNIVGVAQDRAPPYDPQAIPLVDEYTIAALEKACVHEVEFQKQQEALKKEDTNKVMEEEAKSKEEVNTGAKTVAVTTNANVCDVTAASRATVQQHVSSGHASRVLLKPTLLVPSQVASRTVSPKASLSASTIPRIGTVEAPSSTAHAPSTLLSASYTPHDRGHYLAYSAPGSRHASIDNTPFISRAVSPSHGLSVPSHSGLLRPAASTSRLKQLLAEEGVRRSLSPLSFSGAFEEHIMAKLSVSQDWMDPDDMSAFVGTASLHPSHQSSRRSSGNHSPSAAPEDETEGLYLPGLGHPDIISAASSRVQTPRACSPFRSSSRDSKESATSLSGLTQRHLQSMKALPKSQTPVLQELETVQPISQIKQSPPSTIVAREPRDLDCASMSATSPFAFPSFADIGPSAFPSFQDTSPRSPSYMPTHTGRPRAASKILNEAYNAANPSSSPQAPVLPSMTPAEKPDADTSSTTFTPRCPIHSDSCDGKSVSEPYVTQRAREGCGFKDLVPTIDCVDGRVMVDWRRLRDEEMEKMKKERGQK